MTAKWEEAYSGRLLIMTYGDCKPRPKIAGFDMDGTLIGTKSGKVFAVDKNDWQLLYDQVTMKVLQKLHDEDKFKIVVMTNQAGIASGKVKVNDFKDKVEAIARALKVPLQLFCSTAHDGIFRKPRSGVWEYLAKNCNDGIVIDIEKSFYCGDAAGRKKSNGKKDFSCSDRLFAINVGVKFYTPEEKFLGKKSTEEVIWPEFDPRKLLNTKQMICDPETATLYSMDQEVILMVGIQGSGKSFIADHYLKRANYEVVSNDKSGGRDKTIGLLKLALDKGRSVVVDNTHVDVEARKKFIDVAKSRGIPVRCFVMTTTFAHAQHNNVFREIVDADGHAKIGLPLFHSYKSRYQEPTLAEGFTEVIRVNFLPVFQFEEHKALYYMYLVEK